MIPGVSSNTGQNPTEATVNVSFPVSNIPEVRRANVGMPTLGTGNSADSYTIHPNELVVYDRDEAIPGRLPPVFSSLSGLRFNQNTGDAGLRHRLVPVGVAITQVHFKAASGLYDPRITVATNGLVPLRWKSEKIEHPMPGDLVCAYPPQTNSAERKRQLTDVKNNSSGDRSKDDIERDARVPMLMKRFDSSMVDDMIVDALELFCTNPMGYINNPKLDYATPKEVLIYDVLLVIGKFATASDPRALTPEEKIANILHLFQRYANTPTTIDARNRYPAGNYSNLNKGDYFDRLDNNKVEFLVETLVAALRTTIDRCYASVIGRIVRPLIGGDVMIFLG
jgi:hypothetical protein